MFKVPGPEHVEGFKVQGGEESFLNSFEPSPLSRPRYFRSTPRRRHTRRQIISQPHRLPAHGSQPLEFVAPLLIARRRLSRIDHNFAADAVPAGGAGAAELRTGRVHGV